MLTGPEKLYDVWYIDGKKRKFHTGYLEEQDIAAIWSNAARVRKQYPDTKFHVTVELTRPDEQTEKIETDDVWILETPGPGMKERGRG